MILELKIANPDDSYDLMILNPARGVHYKHAPNAVTSDMQQMLARPAWACLRLPARLVVLAGLARYHTTDPQNVAGALRFDNFLEAGLDRRQE